MAYGRSSPPGPGTVGGTEAVGAGGIDPEHRVGHAERLEYALAEECVERHAGPDLDEAAEYGGGDAVAPAGSRILEEGHPRGVAHHPGQGYGTQPDLLGAVDGRTAAAEAGGVQQQVLDGHCGAPAGESPPMSGLDASTKTRWSANSGRYIDTGSSSSKRSSSHRIIAARLVTGRVIE